MKLSSSISAGVALLLVAQSWPAAGQRAPRKELDPYLWEPLYKAVESASRAELDPKRGTANAVEILKAEKTKYDTKRYELALDLRVAATVLRARFLTDKKFSESSRYVQALSTFSRLDVIEPGLRKWIEETRKRHPQAKTRLAKKKDWRIRTAVLIRGSSVDRKKAIAAFAEPLARAGVKLQIVPAKEAQMIIKLGASDAPSDAKRKRAVRVVLGLESVDKGKIVWTHSLYRTEAAPDAQVAVDSSLKWLGRIGGRDLLFRWLGETAFPLLMEQGPKAGKHEHGPRHQRPVGMDPMGRPQNSKLRVKTKDLKANGKKE